MRSVAIVLLVAFAVQAHAVTYVSDSLPWGSLHVTWGKFSSIPYTEQDAISAGWVLTPCKAPISNACDGDVWVGKRYMLNNDIATMLLFDANGQFAGIQGGITTAPTAPNTPPWISQPACPGLPPHWIITLYTRDPAGICTPSTPGSNVIGDRAFVQNGMDYIMLPLEQSDVLATPNELWVEGKCFWTMGKHYWWNISNGMDCDNFFPMFLLYNRGQLNGFGWTYGGQQTSPRWEHPHGVVINAFFNSNTVPNCLFTQPALSTQHIYFTSPYLDFC